MACQAIRYWTLSRLIGAFFDLGIAYFLLCCSTAAYFISRFLCFFGFSLPYARDVDPCLEKLLVDSPKNKISAVQLSVASKFPFDSVWNRNGDSELSLKDKQLKEVIEIEGGGSCSSNVAAFELLSKSEGLRSGVKGGKGATRRRRSNLRRSIDHITLTSDSSLDDFWRCAPVVPSSKCGDSNIGNENTTEDSNDEVENVTELDHISFDATGVTKEMVTLGSPGSNTAQVSPNDDLLKNEIRVLKKHLEEERAARAALFNDLEKERAAAATAADEAMAMILRLQDEKAAIELEARQYERVLVEKSTYDADEMSVLKEIIVAREKEKHSLEKEVESYRKMLRENDELEGDADDVLDKVPEVRASSDYNAASVRSRGTHPYFERVEGGFPLSVVEFNRFMLYIKGVFGLRKVGEGRFDGKKVEVY